MVYGPYLGIVDKVHDGDTIDVKLDLGFDITIYSRCRIAGINAPELATVEGKAARDFAMSVLPVGASVKVTSMGWDKYGGRIDCILKTDSGEDFATIMLDSGHAVPYE